MNDALPYCSIWSQTLFSVSTFYLGSVMKGQIVGGNLLAQYPRLLNPT